jgi:hypothetical protein
LARRPGTIQRRLLGQGPVWPHANGVEAVTGTSYHPFLDVAEITVSGRDTGRMTLANGYSRHGEAVRRQRDDTGEVSGIWLGGSLLRLEAAVSADMAQRYATQS